MQKNESLSFINSTVALLTGTFLFFLTNRFLIVLIVNRLLIVLTVKKPCYFGTLLFFLSNRFLIVLIVREHSYKYMSRYQHSRRRLLSQLQ